VYSVLNCNAVYLILHSSLPIKLSRFIQFLPRMTCHKYSVWTFI